MAATASLGSFRFVGSLAAKLIMTSLGDERAVDWQTGSKPAIERISAQELLDPSWTSVGPRGGHP
jgi:hypothetical protein